jgi:hypothetical protein
VGFQAFVGFQARFKSCHNISIGIRSGLLVEHSKTLHLLLFINSHVDLIVCFEMVAQPVIESLGQITWSHRGIG